MLLYQKWACNNSEDEWRCEMVTCDVGIRSDLFIWSS